MNVIELFEEYFEKELVDINTLEDMDFFLHSSTDNYLYRICIDNGIKKYQVIYDLIYDEKSYSIPSGTIKVYKEIKN